MQTSAYRGWGIPLSPVKSAGFTTLKIRIFEPYLARRLNSWTRGPMENRVVAPGAHVVNTATLFSTSAWAACRDERSPTLDGAQTGYYARSCADRHLQCADQHDRGRSSPNPDRSRFCPEQHPSNP